MNKYQITQIKIALFLLNQPENTHYLTDTAVLYFQNELKGIFTDPQKWLSLARSARTGKHLSNLICALSLRRASRPVPTDFEISNSSNNHLLYRVWYPTRFRREELADYVLKELGDTAPRFALNFDSPHKSQLETIITSPEGVNLVNYLDHWLAWSIIQKTAQYF